MRHQLCQWRRDPQEDVQDRLEAPLRREVLGKEESHGLLQAGRGLQEQVQPAVAKVHGGALRNTCTGHQRSEYHDKIEDKENIFSPCHKNARIQVRFNPEISQEKKAP